MKSTVLNLLILSLVISGCNEKVNPNLDEASAATAIAPKTYIFSITNTSPLILNYKLHRTGPNNSSSKCEITSPTAFTATRYQQEAIPAITHDNKFFDTTCFFEAEELSLYFSGMNFQIDASKNTCEYVGYSPFSYYKYQPGNSSKSVVSKFLVNAGANCAGGSTNVSNGAGGTLPLSCGAVGEANMADTNPDIADSDRAVLTDETVCAFDYTASGGPNCDIGVVSVSETSYTFAETDGTTTSSTAARVINCGGSVANCIGGPITLIPKLEGFTRGTELYQTVINEDFSTEYKLPGGIVDQRPGNLNVVNYRRDLASKDIDFGTSEITYDPPNDAYDIGALFDISAFSGVKSFDPKVMEFYSAARGGNGISLMSTGGPLELKYEEEKIRLGHTAAPLAADPFMGYGPANRTSPFYTFYCFDQAFEVKARIRMAVRDWDRVFYPTSPADDKLALISDIDDGELNARLDNPTGIESSEDDGSYNQINDLHDWEDFLFMERTQTSSVAYPTASIANPIWIPMNGYFNLANFPFY